MGNFSSTVGLTKLKSNYSKDINKNSNQIDLVKIQKSLVEKKINNSKKFYFNFFFIFKLFKFVFVVFFKLIGFLVSKWNLLKKKFLRLLFVGRGFYFKYISHFLLMFMIVLGTSVYLSRNLSSLNFLSKYNGASIANASVLINPGMQSFVAQKQLKITNYIVQPGDTLSSIAAKYSTEDRIITVDTIIWANNLNSNAVLTPGMKLEIPPVSGVLHTVKKGDSIELIAKEYALLDENASPEKITGVLQSIVDINYLNVRVEQQGDKEIRIPEIVEGQRLIIPDGIKKQKIITQPTRSNMNNRITAPIFVDTGPVGIFGWPVVNGLGFVSQGWRPGHPAVDVADVTGPNLVAMDNGVIKSFSYFDGFRDGKCATSIVIAYDTGYESVYCHLSYIQPDITVGMRVLKGQVVGRMGCTGLCTGTHVHIEIRKIDNKIRINPCSLDIFKGKGDCFGRG